MCTIKSLGLLFVMLFFLTNGSISSQEPDQVDRIYFVSGSGPSSEIFVMNPDGSELTRLTNNTLFDIYATMSPDMETIAYMSEHNGGLEVFVMDTDGKNVRRLTDNAFGSPPQWSPDGEQLLFVSEVNDDLELAVIGKNGANLQQLTTFGPEIEPQYPQWSPDGTLIAFVIFDNEQGGIYIINGDGSNLQRLSTTVGDFAWSPDSTHLAFKANLDENPEIYVIKIGTDELIQLTNNDLAEQIPVWSPDGQKIAFAAFNQERNSDIFIIDPDGNNLLQLTTGDANDFSPVWSVDSTMIMFTSNRESQDDIFLMQADGSDIQLIAEVGTSINGLSGKFAAFSVDTVDTDSDESNASDFTPVISFQHETVTNLALAPDGQTLAIATTQEIWLYAMNNLEQRSEVLASSNVGSRANMAWSSDGTALAFVHPFGRALIVFDPIANEETLRITGFEEEITNIAWSADGTSIIVGSEKPSLSLWDVKTGQQIASSNSNHSDGVSINIALSPDGTRIASVSGDGKMRFWDAVTLEQIETVNGVPTYLWDIAWSPDGQKVAFASGNPGLAQIWEASGNSYILKNTLEDRTGGGVTVLAWSPDGKLLATSGDGIIRIWNTLDATLITKIETEADVLEWSVDGKQLISLNRAENTATIWAVAEVN